LIDVRRQYAPDSCLFFHQYDFATPTNISLCDGLVGPWLHPSFADRGWTTFGVDPQFFPAGRSVVSMILREFATMLGTLPTLATNVVVVETQATLNPDTDWANELHPTYDGFVKIAEKFQQALQQEFGERAAAH
jgi:hypothetical protein